MFAQTPCGEFPVLIRTYVCCDVDSFRATCFYRLRYAKTVYITTYIHTLMLRGVLSDPYVDPFSLHKNETGMNVRREYFEGYHDRGDIHWEIYFFVACLIDWTGRFVIISFTCIYRTELLYVLFRNKNHCFPDR